MVNTEPECVIVSKVESSNGGRVYGRTCKVIHIKGIFYYNTYTYYYMTVNICTFIIVMLCSLYLSLNHAPLHVESMTCRSDELSNTTVPHL